LLLPPMPYVTRCVWVDQPSRPAPPPYRAHVQKLLAEQQAKAANWRGSGEAYRGPSKEPPIAPVHAAVPHIRNYQRPKYYVNPTSTPQVAEDAAATYYALSKLKRGYQPAFAERDVGDAWNKEFAAKDLSQVVVLDPLIAVFQQLDANHSGNISLPEMNWALQKVGLQPEMIAKQLAAFDAASKDISALEGGASQVSLAEWEKGLLPEVRAIIKARLDRHGRIIGFEAMKDYSLIFRTFMKDFDTDMSGKLTLFELRKALESLKMNTNSIRKFVSTFAGDMDGFITRDEFLSKLTTDNLEELYELLVRGGFMRKNAAERVVAKDHKQPHLRSGAAIHG